MVLAGVLTCALSGSGTARAGDPDSTTITRTPIAPPRPGYEERAEVHDSRIVSVWRQFRVLDPVTSRPLEDLDPARLEILRKKGDSPEPGSVSRLAVARADKPIALTFVVDTSSSMPPPRAAISVFVELMRRLHPDDYLRVVTFTMDPATTTFLRVDRWQQSAVLALLRQWARKQKAPPDLPDCLAEGWPAFHAGRSSPESPPTRETKEAREDGETARLLAWAAASTPTCQDRLIEQALVRHAGSLFRPSGMTDAGPAVVDAIRATLRRAPDGLLPIYDANLGVIMLTDCEFYVPSSADTHDAIDSMTRLAMIQRWVLTVRTPCPEAFVGAGTQERWHEPPVEQVSRIVEDLRHVHEITFDTTDLSLAQPGGLRLRCIAEDGRELHVVHPETNLPSRQAWLDLLASLPDGPDSDVDKALLKAWAGASPEARQVLRELAEQQRRK